MYPTFQEYISYGSSEMSGFDSDHVYEFKNSPNKYKYILKPLN